MVGETFQIYNVQITEKCICETLPPLPSLAWSDHLSTHV